MGCAGTALGVILSAFLTSSGAVRVSQPVPKSRDRMIAKHGNGGGALDHSGGNGGGSSAEISLEFDTVIARIQRAGSVASEHLGGLAVPMRVFCPLYCSSVLLMCTLLAGKQNIGVLQQTPPPGASLAVGYTGKIIIDPDELHKVYTPGGRYSRLYQFT